MQKVFLSYAYENENHSKYDDLDCKLHLEELLKGVYDVRSIESGEYDYADSEEYINSLVRDEKVSDSSVIIVLCGPGASKCKHMDWEICAGIEKLEKGPTGLVGVILPNHPDSCQETVHTKNLPPRLARRVLSGLASVYDWADFLKYHRSLIQEAFNNRSSERNRAGN